VALVDLLYGLLRFEPSERLTAEEALDHPFFRNPTWLVEQAWLM
jgi:dual-specificity kinase